MIYDIQSLRIKYSMYSNINQKISLEAKIGNLVRIKKGLYTDDLLADCPLISNIILELNYNFSNIFK